MPALSPGTRVGPYEIVAPLGAGGMGEVYRARDSKLNRDVAIKILPETFANDAERIARFQREAKTLASLNHPNIAAIYGLEETASPAASARSGGLALVLELVEGKTLADRVAQGPLPLDEALPIARQIVDALEAAHEQGIVHRDLKPANIKVRPNGSVKVLDFGLAKMPDPSSAGDLSASPTITTPGKTTAGSILGTAAYMSPEQAKGRVVDRRSDIWSFGCVLFELLTGHAAFPGDTVTEVLAGVLKTEPEWNHLPAETPDGVRRLLRRCLNKNWKLRLHDIADAGIELDDAQREGPVPPLAAPSTRRRERVAWASLALVSVIAAAAIAWAVRPTPTAPEVRLEITTPLSQAPASFAVSPDGRRVVYLATMEGKQSLWLRLLDNATPRVIAGTDGANQPFWSPDGRSVGFFADGRLKRVDVDGGAPQSLAPVLAGYGGTWNQDGTILFVRGAAPQPVSRVNASGGDVTSVPATALLAQQASQDTPQFLPDGRHFLYHVSGPPEVQGTYAAELNGSRLHRVIDATATFAAGQLWFLRQGTLYAQAFDTTTLRTSGNPITVADQVAAVSVSSGGTFVYRRSSLSGQRRLAWFDRSGKLLTTVTAGEGADAFSLSPDGRRIAVYVTVDGNADVWMIESRGVRTRFTVESAVDNFPIWSPDGARIVFSSTRAGGPHQLYSQTVSAVGDAELLINTPEVKTATDWSADGRHVLFRTSNPKTGYDVWALSVADRKLIPLLVTNFAERDAQFSPDGKWIAYQSDESGRFEVYVQPFPAPGHKTQVSSAGGGQVRWRRDGELYYIAPDERLMAVAVKPSGDGLSVDVGTAVPLFPAAVGAPTQTFFRQQYDASRDGQRFLMNTLTNPESTPPLTVVLNWKARP